MGACLSCNHTVCFSWHFKCWRIHMEQNNKSGWSEVSDICFPFPYTPNYFLYEICRCFVSWRCFTRVILPFHCNTWPPVEGWWWYIYGGSICCLYALPDPADSLIIVQIHIRKIGVLQGKKGLCKSTGEERSSFPALSLLHLHAHTNRPKRA